MTAPPEPPHNLIRFTFLAVGAALALLLALVALIADSTFARRYSLAAPALVCVVVLAVTSAFSTIRAQHALREREREGSLDSFTRTTYRRCLIGNLAALACASAALGFCIFVLRGLSEFR